MLFRSYEQSIKDKKIDAAAQKITSIISQINAGSYFSVHDLDEMKSIYRNDESIYLGDLDQYIFWLKEEDPHKSVLKPIEFPLVTDKNTDKQGVLQFNQQIYRYNLADLSEISVYERWKDLEYSINEGYLDNSKTYQIDTRKGSLKLNCQEIFQLIECKYFHLFAHDPIIC